jgi:hypothetical protein
MESFHSVVQTLQKEAIMMAEREFEGIQRQLASLRRENRFLKVGLIFCLVLSALPYLTGFQPETISAKRVVTERVEFVRDGKTVMSIVTHPQDNGLIIQDKNNLPAILVYSSQDGGLMGVYDRSGKIVALIRSKSEGGVLGVYNKDGKSAAGMGVLPEGGVLSAYNKDGKPVAMMGVFSGCGFISLSDDKMHKLVLMDAIPPNGTIEIKSSSGQTLWSAP